MIVFWGFVLGLPLLAFGGVLAFWPAKAWSFTEWFRDSKACAAALSAVAWLWTAYECDTIGIDVFDMLLMKEKTSGILVWVLAVVLTYLVVIWMPKNLPVRALSGVLMLIPAELFKTTRFYLPQSGFAAVQLFVATAYVGAVVGMYGMFYPWRLEKGMELVLARSWASRALGALLAADGVALVAIGLAL